MPSPWKTSPSPRRSDSISLVNCRSTEPENKFVPPGGVLDDFRAIERGAEHGGVRVLAAQPAAHAAVDHGGHRVGAQRVRIVFDGERGAARQADARMVPGAGVLVDAVLDANLSFTFGQLFCNLRSQLALALELALALGDDDLQPVVFRGHRVL